MEGWRSSCGESVMRDVAVIIRVKSGGMVSFEPSGKMRRGDERNESGLDHSTYRD